MRQFPDPVLKQRSREVEEFDDDLAALAKRMVSLMEDAHGAGLAAPQIGLLRRVFVYDVSEEDGPVVVVNPEIVDRSDETVVDGEGCLSISLLIDERHDVPVERHAADPVARTGRRRQRRRARGRGPRGARDPARARPLDGILILDRSTREARGDAPACSGARSLSDPLGFAATSAYGADCLRGLVAAGAPIGSC